MTAVSRPGEYDRVVTLPSTCAKTLPNTPRANAISMNRNFGSRLTRQAAQTRQRESERIPGDELGVAELNAQFALSPERKTAGDEIGGEPKAEPVNNL